MLANANEMEMDAKIVKYLITVNDTFQIFRTQMTCFFRRQEQNSFRAIEIDTCMIKCPTMRYVQALDDDLKKHLYCNTKN